MKRNITELPELLRIGKQLGADLFSVSNILAHTSEMLLQILYSGSLFEGDMHASQWVNVPSVSLPRMDLTHQLIDGLYSIMNNPNTLIIGGEEIRSGIDSCPFISNGSISVRWDGVVSPCTPLLHTHDSFIDDHIRKTSSFQVGSLDENSLLEIWESASYKSFRERLLMFDFAPCTLCAFINSCYMAEDNKEDCFGNIHPTCGGCLWAQGFIQCP